MNGWAWSQFYEVRHTGLRIKVTWHVGDATAAVNDFLSGAYISEVAILLGSKPTMDEFVRYLDRVDWQTLLSNTRDKVAGG